ncbi:hypothetical protein V495_00098 [Pseudogymnoascus sp. VKM F-4514 (FW-929)]|nr:hypothetical protein V495_00098 [Pseudogymnoascus sp. VKM F-4514 (FW-929)]KFY67722.1 hypothetical protein V497_00254 [Pseudogymnoascus sp. VKM F-4516 (FW-969)]
MPVDKTPITPSHSTELLSKIQATKPDKAGLNDLLNVVKKHLDLSGFATYERALNEIKEVTLTTTKCTVFLIKGAFEVGAEKINGEGLGHRVEGENALRLAPYAAVVIINTN